MVHTIIGLVFITIIGTTNLQIFAGGMHNGLNPTNWPPSTHMGKQIESIQPFIIHPHTNGVPANL